jgi:hypothetical protein
VFKYLIKGEVNLEKNAKPALGHQIPFDASNTYRVTSF